MGAAAIPYIYAATAAVAAGAAINQSQRQSNYNDYLADQAAADAEAAKGAAQVEAARIRRQARQQRAEAIAALAQSGVDVNSGTALVIDKEIARGGEEDAYLSLTGGSNSALRLNAEAGGYRTSAGAAKTAGYVNATTSLLQGATNNGKGWKTARAA